MQEVAPEEQDWLTVARDISQRIRSYQQMVSAQVPYTNFMERGYSPLTAAPGWCASPLSDIDYALPVKKKTVSAPAPRSLKPAWLPDTNWKWMMDVLTEDDYSWFDRMWEPTEQPNRVLDLTPDPKLSMTILR